MNILVVDDEGTAADIVKRIENMPGITGRVLAVHTGEDALLTIGFFTPDLLITDISITGTNGQPLLSIVHENSLCHDCIILTSDNSFEYARMAVRYHVLDYLMKPVDWSMLEDSIRSLSSGICAKMTVDQVLSEYSGDFKDMNNLSLSYSLRRILKYINTRYANDICLTQLSIYSGMSENSICNLFKKEMGITFLEYLYQLRLKKAMEILLTEQKKPIKEVSALVGYNSERQFFRVFKSKIGLTPQQFRKKSIYEHEL